MVEGGSGRGIQARLRFDTIAPSFYIAHRFYAGLAKEEIP